MSTLPPAGGTRAAPPSRPLRILCLDDSGNGELALATLRHAGFNPVSQLVTTRGEFENCLTTPDYDLVLAGLSLRDWNGPDALELMREHAVDLPFIYLSDALDPEAAVACVKHGASDCVPRDHFDRLPQAVTQALAERRVREERRQARRALSESERRFRALIMATADLIWHADWAGRMSGRLVRWQSYTGQSQTDIAGFGWLDAIHVDDRASARAALDRGIQEVLPFDLDTRIRRADGCYRSFAIQCVPVKDSNGTLLEWIGSGSDTTERRRAGRDLEESEERYRTLAEASFDALVITENEMIVEANRGFAALIGADLEQLAHTRLQDYVAQESRAEVTFRMTSGTRERFAFIAQGSEGRRLELEALTQPSVMRERSVQLTALRDRTAEHEQERQFLHAQRLEAVAQLAGGVAHDFNNILTSVLGFSQSLLDQLPQDNPLRADAEEIYRAGELAAALTRKLLVFGRRLPVNPQVLDLNRLIDDTARMLTRMLGAEIRLELESRVRPALVCLDPGQFEQVMLNLAANARDAMPQGGRLRVRTSALSLSAGLLHAGGMVPAGKYVLLTMADDGSGMTADLIARIFEPFFTTKGGSRGIGLGLSTVYGIVKQSSGHIVVQSAPGSGTTFELYFPAAGVEAATPAVTRSLRARVGEERILVVEDHAAIRALAQRVLSRAGYAVILAANGEEARAVAARPGERFQLILMDILLPGERGPLLAAELRKRHPEARLVFISGNVGLGEEAEVPEEEHWFLQKPFSPEQLLAAVGQALDAPRPARPLS